MDQHDPAIDDETRRQSELLDVELLDVLAVVEGLLRNGREIQRQALRVRGVRQPVTADGQRAAVDDICRRLVEMRKECGELGGVLANLHTSASDLSRVLQKKQGR